ncbi:MAG: hypothetical protein ACLP2P_14205 [Desulfobaccales bacterium]
MKFLTWKIKLALTLMGASAALYLANYLIFRDSNYMLRLFLAQLGFLPISVLLVTIILNQLLGLRAKAAKLAKLNMVIGAFFSEVGGALLKTLSVWDRHLPEFQQQVAHISHWTGPDFATFSQGLAENDFRIELKAGDLEALRDFLLQKRDFLLRLLENPNLLEHDSFANLLLAVFHLTEELAQRTDLHRLSGSDQEHLAGDVQRGYVRLIKEWLAYMAHLQSRYPYLFSLALRTNPFDPFATPEIK